MSSTTAETVEPSELTILARVLGKDRDRLPVEMARYLVTLGFGDRDQRRMHDLAVRHQAGTLSPAEREELFAYSKAGTLLSILKSRARRVLHTKLRKRSTP
jgi:hypothetical protein